MKQASEITQVIEYCVGDPKVGNSSVVRAM